MKSIRIALLATALALSLQPALAGITLNQVPTKGSVAYGQLPDGSFWPLQMDNSNTLSVNGAGGGGGGTTMFTPNGNVANLAVTTSSANVALPATSTVVAVTNKGSFPALVKLSVGASTAATTDAVIMPGAVRGFTVGTNTYINAITASGTASLSIQGGAGVVGEAGGVPADPATATNQAALNTATGAPASTVCATSTGTCDLTALIKKVAAWLEAVNTAQATAVPAGTNTIGATAGESATGAAVPAKASYAGAVSSGNLTGIIQADASVAINISTATTTQLVALTSAQKIYVTAYKVIAGGTGNFKFVYGTGTNCGTGTADLEGNNNLIAQSGSAIGNGLGPVLVVPAGNALCATTSAAVQMSGHLAYTKF